MKEELKSIIGYENYEISNMGYIRNTKTKRKMSGCPMRCGYIRVKLSKNGKYKSFLLHRLVAEHFIDNPENKKEVNHKGEKNDNKACMLEWATRKENCQHSAKYKTKNYYVPVQKICPETGEVLKTYKKIIDVEKDNYVSQCVNSVLFGKTKTHAGFLWKRVNPIQDEKKIEDEKWVELKNSIYNEINIFDKYKISNYGRIRGWYGRLLTKNKHSGVETIKLTSITGKTVIKKIHRIMLMAFNVPQPDEMTEVDHIDSNHFNNHLSNLRWANRKIQSENKNTIKKRPKTNLKQHYKFIVIKDGEERLVSGLVKLSKETGISQTTINKYAKSGKKYKEYTFKRIIS